MTPEQAISELDEVAAGASRYPSWLSRLTTGLSGVAIALLFGAGAVAAGFAFLAYTLVDLLYGFLGRRNWPAFFIQVLVGVLAVLVAACVHAIVPGADSSAVVVAVIMMMLADMTSTGAVQDLMTGWHLTGLGRLTEGVMNTIGLIVGIRVTRWAACSRRRPSGSACTRPISACRSPPGGRWTTPRAERGAGGTADRVPRVGNYTRGMKLNGNAIAILVIGLIMAAVLWYLSTNVAGALVMAVVTLAGAAVIQWLMTRDSD